MTHADATAAAFAAAAQAASAASAVVRSGAASLVTEDVPVRPMPSLGRGIVWSDIAAVIERDQRVRDADGAA